jgi:hypothetical protein
MDGGDLLVLTENEISAAAGIALEAMSAMPPNADTLAGLPQRDAGGDFVDAAGDFVSRHARILQAGPDAFFDQSVAMADAARFNFDADLAGAGLGNGAVDHFQISVGLADLDGFHGEPF